MNYQQVIADAIRQLTFQTVDAATTVAAAGFGSLSCSPAVADAATTVQAYLATTVADAATTTVAATTGFGLSSFSSSAATTAAVAATMDADAN